MDSVRFSFIKRPKARFDTVIRDGLQGRVGAVPRAADMLRRAPSPAPPQPAPDASPPTRNAPPPRSAADATTIVVTPSPPPVRSSRDDTIARAPGRGRDTETTRPMLENTRFVPVGPQTVGADAPPRPAFERLPLPPGHMVHKYRIEKLIGEGGFALTYAALEPKLGRRVVLKELFMGDLLRRGADLTLAPRADSTDPGLLDWARFLFSEEARITFGLRHEGIVRMYEFFTTNNTAYIALELIEGPTLKSWCLEHQHKPDNAEVLRLVDQVGAAVKYLHKQGVLHRDIKPDNILMETHTRKPVLIDFGAALETTHREAPELAVVTEGYSPPEQYLPPGNQRLDERCDVYALCATLYWMLAGEAPPPAPKRAYGTDTLADLKTRVDPGFRYSDRLIGAVMKGLSVAPEQRQSSIDEFVDDVFPKVRLATSGYEPRPLGRRVFVSYRREDSAHFSGRLLDFLELRLGSGNVFYDIQSIPAGMDFWDYIKRVMSDCAAAVVVMGPHWRRLLIERRKRWYHIGRTIDYVEQEVAAAGELRLPVIPLLFDGAIMPRKAEVPPDIRYLTGLNAVIVGDGRAFRPGVGLLCDQIAELQRQSGDRSRG